MGAIKAKGDKKLRKTVEIEGPYDRVHKWMEAHARWALGAVFLCLAALLASWGVESYSGARETQARNAYAKIVDALSGPTAPTPDKWKELIPELENFTKEYSGAEIGRLALLDLMEAYFQANRYDDAVKAGMEALQKLPAEGTIAPLVRYQLAIVKEKTGDPDAALALWAPVQAGRFAALERELRWHFGMSYESRQEYGKAVEQYEKALKLEGAYPESALLDAELASAKIKTGSGSAPSNSVRDEKKGS